MQRPILKKNIAELSSTEYVEYGRQLTLQTLMTLLQSSLPDSMRKHLIETVRALNSEQIPHISVVTNKLIPIIQRALSYEAAHKGDPLRASMDDLVYKLDNLITTYNVLRYHVEYGIQINPDPAYKKLPGDEIIRDFSKGVPEDILHAMIADPQFCLVYVTGASLNKYGHALIFLGMAGFIHIDGTNNPPKHLTIRQFNHYLNEHGKSVLAIQKINLLSLNDTILAVCKMINENYRWGGIKHNCIDFCHDVLREGGYDAAKQPEYKDLFLSLPTNFLAQTSPDDLRPDTSLFTDKRPSFNPDVFLTTNILSIDVTKNFLPDEMIKFVKYILDHVEEVILAQKTVLLNEFAAADEEPPLDMLPQAGINIIQNLLQLKKDIDNKYYPLFNPIRLARINTLLADNFETKITEGMNNIIQSQLTAKTVLVDVKPLLFTKTTPAGQGVNIRQSDDDSPDQTRKP